MLPLLAVVCLAWPAAATLPDVTVSHKDGHLHFKMSHFPGAKQVFFDYVLHTVEDKLLPKVGKAVLGGDGQWLWRDLQHVLQPGDKVQYDATVYGKDGKLHGPTKHWVYAPTATLGPRRTRAVIFRDDFNSFDRSNWNVEISMYGGMNWEFQVYVPDSSNIFTRSGNLYLKPTQTTDDPRFDNNFLYHGVMDVPEIWGTCTQSANYGCHREGQYGLLPPVMSGKIWSKPTLRYGHVEVRARIPRGDWIWPAIWMMPRDSAYGTWPRSGEIDIMESRGNVNCPIGPVKVSSTLHWGTAWDANHFQQTTHELDKPGGGNWGTDFHTWTLDWNENGITTKVDGTTVLHVNPGANFCQFGHLGSDCPWSGHPKMAPFDKDFYLILNVAVGGTNGFFPDGQCNKPWSNGSPHAAQDFWEARGSWHPTWHGDNVAMMVDYVQFSTL